LPEQHAIGREEAREHHDVGEQEYPEAVSGHDPLWCRAFMSERRILQATQVMRIAMPMRGIL